MKNGNSRESVHVVNQKPNKNKPEVFNYHIDQWVGRLGNNLLQLAHAIAMAYKYGGRVTYEPHEIIKSIPITFGRPQDNLSIKIVNDVDCFALEDRSFAKSHRYDMLKKFGSSLLGKFTSSIPCHDITFHFRGGDIWGAQEKRIPFFRDGDTITSKPRPLSSKLTSTPSCCIPSSIKHREHGHYVQASLAYYETILEQEKPKRVLMICEDSSSPLIEELEHKYKKNIHLKVSVGDELERDIEKIFNSRVLVASSAVSTFIPALVSCSNTIEKTYFPIFSNSDSALLRGYKNICSETYGLRHYDYIKQGDWDPRGWPEQIQVMLNYPKSNIKAESA
jgi:hypothetical protein